MTDDDISKFIIRLHEKTAADRVPWQNTNSDTAFDAEFPPYTVRIKQVEGFDPDVGEEYTTYSIVILDDDGREIDAFSPFASYMKGFAGERIFRETYESARRKARGLDLALATLLVDLGSAEPKTEPKTDDLDDEIPF